MQEPSSLVGRTIAGRYRLIAPLGSGGMASVYLARHVLIDRLSAIKVLHPQLVIDRDYKDRFLREARAVNRINHPNIVEISDYGEADGLAYLVMEYVPGESLARHLDRSTISWERAASIGFQVAQALGRAHEMDVVHRDLKPANVLIVQDRGGRDMVKLTDFGAAKILGAATLTRSTIALGTPGYFAPEYIELGQVDGRTDLFALGIILYEAVAGERPFRDDLHACSLPLDLPAPELLSSRVEGVPRAFSDAVAALLSRDPDDRPRDGFETAALLKRAQSTEVSVSMPADTEKVTRGPHLTTIPFQRIAPTCAEALAELLDQVGALPKDGRLDVDAAVSEAREQVGIVETIARLIEADLAAVDEEQRRGRAIRAELGARVDALGEEHSRALGWSGTLDERSDTVRSRRSSGFESIADVEAMVWEQAVLEHEQDRTQSQLDTIVAESELLRGEVARINEQLEHSMLVASARLDGHIAALRSTALGAWLAIEEAKRVADRASKGAKGPR